MSETNSWIGAVISAVIGLVIAVMLKGFESILPNLVVYGGIFSITIYKIFVPKRDELIRADIFHGWLKYEFLGGIAGGLFGGLFVFGSGSGHSEGQILGIIFGYIAYVITLWISSAKERTGTKIVSAIFSIIYIPLYIGNIFLGALIGAIVGALGEKNTFSAAPMFTIPLFIIPIFAIIGYKVGNPVFTWIGNKVKQHRLEKEQYEREREEVLRIIELVKRELGTLGKITASDEAVKLIKYAEESLRSAQNKINVKNIQLAKELANSAKDYADNAKQIVERYEQEEKEKRQRMREMKQGILDKIKEVTKNE